MRRLRHAKYRTGQNKPLARVAEKTTKLFRVTLDFAFYEAITQADLDSRILAAMRHPGMPKGRVVTWVNGDFSTEESRMPKSAAEKTEAFEEPQDDEQNHEYVNDLPHRSIHRNEVNEIEKHSDDNQGDEQSYDGHARAEAKGKP